ncbi:patatin-like phospholipase family protein [Burkholderia cenocepacia]|jgi:NTE family protein|uniref:patatin-like phospholipase family protein n=1 Tax=Burkholderia cenocepacia TaxID=95486 RepID=UPI00084665F8|nr:patatin-like phospholipase family protein [Burkholderia cenocepacia]
MERRRSTKKIALALQGGGSHGAFTWGVLDRLLEDERLVIESMSGTSAGAVNAAVLADGFEKGGAQGAREALARFWSAMAQAGIFSPYRSGPLNPLGPDWSPVAQWWDWISQIFSPSQLNPLNFNPLRNVLSQTIDFACVRRCQKIQLYVSATNVRTNSLRIFTGAELSAEVLLASACLPQLYPAVAVDGEYYWDGGYLGNPVLEPLVDGCTDVADIVLVQVDPFQRDAVPRTAHEIASRVNEISFNASLMREIRTIAGITQLIADGVVKDPRYKCVYFHRIAAEEMFRGLGAHSKLDTHPAFLARLRDCGREAASTWIAGHFADLGRRTTLELSAWRPVAARATTHRQWPEPSHPSE